MAIYPKTIVSAFATIRRLRDTGCQLPIELWIRLDEMEENHPIVVKLVEKYHAFVRTVNDDDATRFYVKPYAVYYRYMGRRDVLYTYRNILNGK
jgi:alpha 1,2-mannosyltransferase